MADKLPKGWVDRAWDGSAGRWETAERYCSACLIDLNPKGKKKVKDLCHLPVKEPSGETNRNAVHAAAGGRGIARLKGVPAAAKKKAARALVRLYGRMGEVAPESVYRIAGERRPRG